MKLAGSILGIAVCAILAACSGGGGATTRPSLPAIPSLAVPSIAIPSLAVPSGAGASHPAGSGASSSAQQLCALLTASDWANVQLSQAAAQPVINSDSPTDAYCVYSGVSGATGGLEFDAFIDDTTQNAQETYNTIAGETPGGQPVSLPGTDSALINTDVEGTYGAIIVRNGRFTYTISLPAGNAAQTQLETLAALVLTRAQQFK